MTSKAALRAARRLRNAGHPFALASIPARLPSGRVASEPADHLALDARARHLRLVLMVKPSMTATDARREARAPWWGCLAGRQMAEAVRHDADRQALWDAMQHMRRVQAAYDASLGAPRRHAACLSVLVPSSGLSADAASPDLDTRSEVERCTDAERAWMQMQAWLMAAPASARAAALALVLDDRGCGQAFNRAHPALVQVVQGLGGRQKNCATYRATA